MISCGGQPRRARAAVVVRELAHERRGVDAVAGHVADDERDLAAFQRDDVEPVAAHLRGPAGGLVAVRGLQSRHLRDVLGQQAALQGG